MADETFEVKTDVKTHRGLTRGQVERYIDANVLRPTDKIRNESTGAEWKLREHPDFGRLLDRRPERDEREQGRHAEEYRRESSREPVRAEGDSRDQQGHRSSVDESSGPERRSSFGTGHEGAKPEPSDRGNETGKVLSGRRPEEREKTRDSGSDTDRTGFRRIGLIIIGAVVPGAGHVLLGRWKKGGLLFGLAVVSLLGAGIASIVSALDVYNLTSGEGVDDGFPFSIRARTGGDGGRVAPARIAVLASWVVGAVGMWLFVLSFSGSGKGPESSSVDGETSAAAVRQEPEEECTERHARCEVNGVAGRCVRGGWCMASGPGCIHDVDCWTRNPCVESTCREGRCHQEPAGGSCERSEDEQGQCRRGLCEPAVGQSCFDNSDCPDSRNDCTEVRCVDGKCQERTLADGEQCQTSSDAPGTCNAGRCKMDRELASKRRKTNCRQVHDRWGRARRHCDRSLRFLLSDEKLREVRKTIRERIQEQMRYDTMVSLIELPDGGYNILTTNLRSRDKVRGLVDPSFVAFTMAGYTDGTAWRSRQLQIWVAPYEEGWAIPTSGARVAMDRGRSNSFLGSLGVVDVRAYREWLEKNFQKLANPTGYLPTQSSNRGASGGGTGAPPSKSSAEEE